ncbi:putative protease with chaperone activity [Pseudomonas aeruginosa]|nr:putative protease with chaperone activity [Pseudomonas aeruginosa]
MSTLLALDTSTEACSVALLHEGRALSHYEVIPRLHAQRLLPMVRDLLDEAGVALSAVDAIAFGRGPGAFTGVRIAIGVVQGLASPCSARYWRSPTWRSWPSGPTASRVRSGSPRPSTRGWTRSTGVATSCNRARCAWPAAKRYCRPSGSPYRGTPLPRTGSAPAPAGATSSACRSAGRAGREPAAACRGLAQPGRLRLGARRRRGGGTGAAGVPARQRGDAEKSALKMPRSGNCQAFRGWLECGDFPGF